MAYLTVRIFGIHLDLTHRTDIVLFVTDSARMLYAKALRLVCLPCSVGFMDGSLVGRITLYEDLSLGIGNRGDVPKRHLPDGGSCCAELLAKSTWKPLNG